MKNTGKRNEIAAGKAQDLPDTAISSGEAGGDNAGPKEKMETARSSAPESIVAFPGLDSSAQRSGDSSARTETPIGSVRAGQLAELVSNEVRVFKQTKADFVQVVLKPDQQTQIFIQFHWRDGQINAYARCQEGDTHALGSQWSQLQNTLSHQGVRLFGLGEAPPAGGLPNQTRSATADSTASHTGGQPHRDHRQQSESLDELPLVGSVTEPLKTAPRKTARIPKGLFDSWA